MSFSFLAQTPAVSTDVTDPLSFWEYGIYFVVAVIITVWVGRTLFAMAAPSWSTPSMAVRTWRTP